MVETLNPYKIGCGKGAPMSQRVWCIVLLYIHTDIYRPDSVLPLFQYASKSQS